ncbi:hypothetical protein EG857_15090, partial [Enterococcus faecalis]
MVPAEAELLEDGVHVAARVRRRELGVDVLGGDARRARDDAVHGLVEGLDARALAGAGIAADQVRGEGQLQRLYIHRVVRRG